MAQTFELQHSNPTMLRYIRCIISLMCHVYVIMKNEGSVFENEISTLRIHSGHFENSTVMH
jgi:hypothetical protein